MNQIDVSIIIVNYNTKDITRECIRSVIEQTQNINYEIIVSDNGSSDGSVQMIKSDFPEVIIIENNANLGFGSANNKGLDKARGKYIFYLNSDTILLNNTVKIFFDYWENSAEKEKIGILGSWLLTKDQSYTKSWGPFPSYSELDQYLYQVTRSAKIGKYYQWFKALKKETPDFSHKETKEITGYISGADNFMLNNEDARFDENYFMYFEETDLQYNHFFLKGKKSIILDTPKIIHLEGASTANRKTYDFTKRTSIAFWISAVRFLKKNNLASENEISNLKEKILKNWMHYKNKIDKKFFEELMSL